MYTKDENMGDPGGEAPRKKKKWSTNKNILNIFLDPIFEGGVS